MNNRTLAQLVDSLEPVTLDELDDKAKLHTRKDRKYLVAPDVLTSVIGELSPSMQALDVDGIRWFSYGSLYFDTPDLVSYRMAATRRALRFKVRTRTYFDSKTVMVELKTKNRRGKTVKVRQSLPYATEGHIEATRTFAARFPSVALYASALDPVLAVWYRRSTVAFEEPGVRATIDKGYQACASGGTASCGDQYIVETKSSGKPGPLDRRLWRAGVRPVKVSKYTTGLAAIRPELPSNRWHRVLRNFSTETEPSSVANPLTHPAFDQVPDHRSTRVFDLAATHLS